MNKRKLTIIATCVLTLGSVAGGQERKLTLQEAMDLALRQNRGVKIAHYAVAAELEKQRGARSAYFPTLSNESNALYITDVERIEVPPGTFGAIPGGALIPNSTVFLTQGQNAFQSSGTMLAQPLTQLIKIHQANKITAAGVGISEAGLKKTSTDVAYSVHELYYKLGMPLDTKLALDPEVNTVFDLPSREESLQTALKENPTVQQALQKLAAARAAKSAAKAEYIPDITGFVRHSYQNGVPFVNRNFGTVGIHLSYDLFDAGKRNALIRERRDEVSEAEEDVERTKEEVGVRITTVYNKLETTRAMVEVAREELAARQENARLSDVQFKQGALLTSQRDASHAQAMKAQAGLLEASLDYLLARDELTRTLGRTAP